MSVGGVSNSSFKILSLDGGGLKGLFTAKFLCDLENDLDLHVADYFDLITGTSTGAIIAIALGLGISAADILKFYRENGPSIFDAPSFGLFKTKYDSKPLRDALCSVFRDKTLADSKNRLVIPAFNIQRREVKLFKTKHSPRFLRDSKFKAVDVAMASAAAPTYLPSFIDDSYIEYIDGGVWANNPSLIGIIEAMTVLKTDRSKIHLLSVGTTREAVRMDSIKSNTGRVGWAAELADVFIGADMVAADASASTYCATIRIKIQRGTVESIQSSPNANFSSTNFQTSSSRWARAKPNTPVANLAKSFSLRRPVLFSRPS